MQTVAQQLGKTATQRVCSVMDVTPFRVIFVFVLLFSFFFVCAQQLGKTATQRVASAITCDAIFRLILLLFSCVFKRTDNNLVRRYSMGVLCV
jgi:di/tricarboxylate transporter